MKNPEIAGKESVNAEINSVLLAENDREQCFFFKKALMQVKSKFQFTEVHDGNELLKLLENFMPDILFIDLNMPAKNGMDCIKEIRKKKAYDSLPIVVYSITTQSSVINAAYNAGAQLYLVKPAEYYTLVHSLSKILQMDWSNLESVKERFVKKDQYNAFQDG